jgi:UDP-N-acetyl-2-amino-2-deoxyglucuronate dehydrogenase
MSNFALTGVAGYIAPRHLQAIKDTGNQLVAAVDPHDSVGILDRHFPQTAFFSEFERFDRHLEKLKRKGEAERVHYLSICSPNHLHDAHIRLALRVGAHAICEKPLVLKPWNLDALSLLEEETHCRVYTILQLRVHPALLELKARLEKEKSNRKHDLVLTYITSRGTWYGYSWKGVKEKSGGIAANIGVHFFDMLLWLFGPLQHSEVHVADDRRMAGFLELKNANVRWLLSIRREDLPAEAQAQNKSTYRSLLLDGQEIEFSDGFTDLHTRVYERTLAGAGFGIEDARPAIVLVHQIGEAKTSSDSERMHPFVAAHPQKPHARLVAK